MGGDANYKELCNLALNMSMGFAHDGPMNITQAWYSGQESLPKDIEFHEEIFKYIKIGPYIKEKGPLNNPNTNQKLYQLKEKELIDITYKF